MFIPARSALISVEHVFKSVTDSTGTLDILRDIDFTLASQETAVDALTSDDEVTRIRSLLHKWVDGVVGAVSSPGVGRVTLIHADGTKSKIACPRLPFVLSRPAKFD